jgi:hypothetical protein
VEQRDRPRPSLKNCEARDRLATASGTELFAFIKNLICGAVADGSSASAKSRCFASASEGSGEPQAHAGLTYPEQRDPRLETLLLACAYRA